MIGTGLTIFESTMPRSRSIIDRDIRQVPFLVPGGNWSGEPGSGFSVVPTDPLRVTAKPALRLITVPSQRYSNRTLVGAIAFANDGGTLIGGIDRVRFQFEGRSVDVVEPTWHRIPDANGIERSYFGYWVNLRKAGPASGEALLYVEAIPADATMQNRVIGPFSYFPAATAHDLELEIAATPDEVAGERYKTLQAALLYCRQVSAQAPLVTFTESTFSTTYSATHPRTDGFPGWATITHAPGVTVTFGKPAFETDNPSWRTYMNRLHFKGSGLVFDFRNVSFWRIEETYTYWLDGVRVINSDPAGVQALWAKGPRPTGFLFDINCYYTEVHAEWSWNLFQVCQLSRGNLVEQALNDLHFSPRGPVVFNRVINGNNTAWWNQRDTPAMTLTYNTATGNGSAATVSRSGGVNANTTWTFRVDGATVGTFTLLDQWTEYLGTQYNVSDLVNYVNGTLAGIDPGFSAVLLDDTRKGAWLGLKDLNGKSFGQQNIADTTLNLFCEFDLHADFVQLGDSGTFESTIVAFNEVRAWGGQIIWLGGNSLERTINDAAIVGNLFRGGASGWRSHVKERTLSHVVICHNTWVDQVFSMASDTAIWEGKYSLIANNTAPGMQGTAGTVTVKNNHVEVAGDRAGSGSTISGSVNDTVGGTGATNFIDAVGGDFRPAGELLANQKAPVWSWPTQGLEQTAASPAGAVVP